MCVCAHVCSHSARELKKQHVLSIKRVCSLGVLASVLFPFFPPFRALSVCPRLQPLPPFSSTLFGTSYRLQCEKLIYTKSVECFLEAAAPDVCKWSDLRCLLLSSHSLLHRNFFQASFMASRQSARRRINLCTCGKSPSDAATLNVSAFLIST